MTQLPRTEEPRDTMTVVGREVRGGRRAAQKPAAPDAPTLPRSNSHRRGQHNVALTDPQILRLHNLCLLTEGYRDLAELLELRMEAILHRRRAPRKGSHDLDAMINEQRFENALGKEN